MVSVTSSGSGMAAFDTAPDTHTTSCGSETSSSTSLIVTVKATGVAGDTVAVTVTGCSDSKTRSLLSCSVTSSPGGIAAASRFTVTV